MQNKKQQQAAKAFVNECSGRGYEKGGTQRFWLSLLHNVFGVDDPTKVMRFELPVKPFSKDKGADFIDAYITTTPFRMCGFARNPSRKEAASIDFEYYGTPYAFENRLMLVEDGQDTPIVNSFYIRNITNYNKESITRREILIDCEGRNMREVYYNGQAANNKFYINYIPDN